MAKESLGYVRLEWTCPACGRRNPGPVKICAGCGAPQPEDVQFEQAAQETLISDDAEIQQAKAGPDVHCAFCGARNPAGASHCSQCLADLSEGAARATGRVVGAHRKEAAADVACAACGSLNPATAPTCSQCGANLARAGAEPRPVAAAQKRRNPVGFIVLGAIVLIIGLFFFLLLRTDDTIGTVSNVSWTRSIGVESLAPMAYEGWRDDIPAGAVVGECRQEVSHTQDEPAENAEQVCGTPYTVDDGTGFGEVVQDCEYQVYADRCEYTVEEWQEVDVATVTGSDFSPAWPQLQLDAGERAGEEEEEYEVIFDTDNRSYTYTTDDAAEFARFAIGSPWILQVNSFNAVVSVEPAN